MNNVLLLAVAVTGVFVVLAVYFAILDYVSNKQAGKATSGSTSKRANASGVRSVSATANRAGSTSKGGRLGRLALWIEQSGMRLRPIELIGAACTIAFVSAVAVVLLVSSWWLALLACLTTAPMPFGVVAIERYRRSDKIRSQLPDALDLMSRMLRAGQTISQSLSGVADEFESPIADEFGYCYEQQNLGLSTEAAMYEMARRTGVLEIRILVVALTVHRQAGGNLSELLDNLAKVIRERYRIQGQIRSLTADGRLQAAILLALPPILLVVLSIVNQDYVDILFQFPGILVGMFGFELFGALWLHRIVSFDF